MKRSTSLALAIKLTVLGLVIWAVHGTVRGALEQLRSEQAWSRLELHFGWLTLAGTLYLVGFLPSALFWRQLLLALGQRPGLAAALRAYYIGHLGKYIPGKAMVFVMRAALVRGPGVDTKTAAVTVAYETLTSMAAGAAISAIALAFWPQAQAWWIAAAAAMALCAGLPTLPPLFARVSHLLRLGASDAESGQMVHRLSYRTVALGWLGMSLGWLVMGLAVWAVLRGMGLSGLRPVADLPLYTAAIALGTVAGILALIPGGVFIREMVVLELLASRIGEDYALTAAILLRLVSLGAELALAAALYPLRPRRA